MSERYSKSDIREIAEYLVEDLRECEDGTVTTTGRLARASGYDDMETFDLFDLHDALFKAARANHITLDMSEHKDKVEGLPFNLTFVVRNKKAQIKCPRCGSQNTARYIYGYPAFSEEMQKMLDDDDMENYVIKIHAMKGNARTVGLEPLADFARLIAVLVYLAAIRVDDP